MLDISDLYSMYLDALHEEPDGPTRVQKELLKTCGHHCQGCMYAIRNEELTQAACYLSGEVVGRERVAPWEHTHYIEYVDGEYPCEGCGNLTPDTDDSTITLCPDCAKHQDVI